MLKYVCSVACGNSSQSEFTDTENGILCASCGQVAIVVESDEIERRYSKEYIEAEFTLS